MFSVTSTTTPVQVRVLGAGGEVGRSCFLISIGDKDVLVDAGLHMNPSTPHNRTPLIPNSFNIQCVIITHYHLDHIGALPYLTEILDSPVRGCEILMTAPTAILAPPVMTDYCRGGSNADLYMPNHVHDLFGKVKYMHINSPILIGGDRHGLQVTAFHVGHVLGGVGLLLEYRGVSVVYTGDFSVSKDSLLHPIQVPTFSLPPGGVDVVISEATHATTVNNKDMTGVEHELCERVCLALERGGRVLIPIFAVGRTQELAAIIRKRLGYSVKLFTTSMSGQRACVVTTDLMSSWTCLENQVITRGLEVSFLPEDAPFPLESCVVFSSPAMLEGGSSLRLFREICGDRHNLVILTGYCNTDTVGNSVILFASRNVRKREIHIHGERVDVLCECYYSPFTNHSDSLGIEKVLRQLVPRNVVLVHGEKKKIESFKQKLKSFWSDKVRIDVPNNYDVLEYEFPIRTRFRDDQKLTISRVVKALVSDLKTVREKIAHGIVGVTVDLVEEGRLRVSQGTECVTVSLSEIDEMKIEFELRFGFSAPEWSTRNRLYTKIENLFGDNFSISECSV